MAKEDEKLEEVVGFRALFYGMEKEERAGVAEAELERNSARAGDEWLAEWLRRHLKLSWSGDSSVKCPVGCAARLQYGKVQYSTVQYSIVRYSTEQYSTVLLQSSSAQYSCGSRSRSTRTVLVRYVLPPSSFEPEEVYGRKMKGTRTIEK